MLPAEFQSEIDRKVMAMKKELLGQIQQSRRKILDDIKSNGLDLGNGNIIKASGNKLLINNQDLLVKGDQGPPGPRGPYSGKWIEHVYKKILLQKGDCIGDKAIKLAMEWAAADARIRNKEYTWSYKTKEAGFDLNGIYVDFVITFFVRSS